MLGISLGSWGQVGVKLQHRLSGRVLWPAFEPQPQCHHSSWLPMTLGGIHWNQCGHNQVAEWSYPLSFLWTLIYHYLWLHNNIHSWTPTWKFHVVMVPTFIELGLIFILYNGRNGTEPNGIHKQQHVWSRASLIPRLPHPGTWVYICRESLVSFLM